jgi:hypothetical protein
VTLLLTATSHPSTTSTASLILLALLAVVIYIGLCVIWPFGPCRKCQGLGRFHAPGSRAWRNCRRCKGTGARVRTGRRIFDLARGTRNRARR